MAEDRDMPPQGPRLLIVRLAIGLGQGLALYALWRWRANLSPPLLGALVLTAALLPIAALGAYGTLRPRTLAVWLAGAAAVVAGLGAYHLFVGFGLEGLWPSPWAYVFAGATLFIAHHLIAAAQAEGRWRATYGRYFDYGWKDGVRLALAAAFVGALWLLLYLGAALFHLIGLDFLQELIKRKWFAWPATGAFFAMAVHVTDVRAELVRGARTLALTLLSWLLPVMTLIAAGFLAALPFTGLAPLWATDSSSGIMLGATAALIILINAAYQDGERTASPVAIRWAVRVAGLVLPLLVAIAAYGVALRIGQHGLTPPRIYAVVCLAVAACYAAGYAWAAVSRGPWMERLETTNWITAQVAVVAILLTFSPLVDPQRIAAHDQLRRLEAGKVSPAEFDYRFLRFDAGRWGRQALEDLASRTTGPAGRAAARAREVLKMTSKYGAEPVDPARRASAIPGVGGPLPASFLNQTWPADKDPFTACAQPTATCVGVMADIQGDPAPEIVVLGSYGPVFALSGAGWTEVGRVNNVCSGDDEAVGAGRYRLAPPAPNPVLEVDGRPLVFQPHSPCPSAPAPPRRPPPR